MGGGDDHNDISNDNDDDDDHFGNADDDDEDDLEAFSGDFRFSRSESPRFFSSLMFCWSPLFFIVIIFRFIYLNY